MISAKILLGWYLLFAPLVGIGQSANWSFEPKGKYPEGIAHDPATGLFYVTSLKHGIVGTLDPVTGYRVFSEDKDLISSAGLAIDTTRRRLLVVVHDDGASPRSQPDTREHLARLVIFNLDNAQKQQRVELNTLLKGRSHGNDVTLDRQGNAYVTDSFQPVIYRVTPAGGATIFLQDEAFRKRSQKNNDPALNGITYHPDGFLLVTDYEKGKLWNISLEDPSAFQEVRLPGPLLGADGIRLIDESRLAVARTFQDSTQTFVSQVDVLESANGWQSATVAQHYRPASLNCPTTVEVVQDTLYVTNSHFKELFESPPSEHDTETFVLTKIGLDP